MKFEYVPLLQVQRELQGLPRNLDRFRQYLRALGNDDEVVLPPLGIVNPMAREHVTALLDEYLALGADLIAERTAADVGIKLAKIPGEFNVALVVVDDLRGGWSNRYDYEFGLRFGLAERSFSPDPSEPSGFRLPRWLKDYWLTGVLWSSEPASERAVREAVLLPAHRLAYILRHGPAQTLRDMLRQEGFVMTAAGCQGPVLEKDDIDYTREVLSPFLDTNDKRTVIECMFGDDAGRTLGFTPRGLSKWAGLALALHDAQAESHAAQF